MPSPVLSVIIVNWKSKKHIERCLDCLSRQTFKNFEIIVVDNGSNDGSLSLIKEICPCVTIIDNRINQGFCRANNVGIEKAGGEFILTLNPDVFLSSSYLDRLLQQMKEEERIGSATGKLLLFKDGKESNLIDSTGLFLKKRLSASDRGNLEIDKGQFENMDYTFAACGAATLFRRKMLEDAKVGNEYFDEDFFAYYEDLDLGWRSQLYGWKCLYVPSAVAYHVRGGSEPSKFFKKSLFFKKHTLKNRYLLLVKNISLTNFFLYFPYLLLTEILLAGYIAIRSPRLFSFYGNFCKLLPGALKKRKIIQEKRVATSGYIRKFII